MPLLRRIVHVGARPYRGLVAYADMFARGRDVAGRGRSMRAAARDRPERHRLYPLHLGIDLDAEGRAAAALRADREHVAHRRAHARDRARPALARGVAVLGAGLRERPVQPDDPRRLRRAAGELRAGRGAAHHRAGALHACSTACRTWCRRCSSIPTGRNTTSRRCGAAARSARPSSSSASSISASREFSTIYGLTEILRQLHRGGRGTIRSRSSVATVGRPLPGVDLRIIDPETGKRAAARHGRRDPR